MAPPPPQPTRVTVLISGGGTNLQALIDAQQRAGSRPYRVVRVVSNRRDAYGLTRARDAGIPTAYHNLRAYRARLPGDEAAARAAYDADLAGVVLRGSVAAEQAGEGGGGGGDRPDLVVCAGFMHVLGKVFLDRMCEKGVPIINLHPALPGEFDGVGAIARAHEAWMKGEISRTGIMIHYVIEDVDRGEPLVTEEVPMEHPRDDRLEDFEERMHQVEHSLIVKGVGLAIERLLSSE